MEVPLYSKGVYTICSIDRVIDFDTKRGESKSIVIISNAFSKIFRLYELAWGKHVHTALVSAVQ